MSIFYSLLSVTIQFPACLLLHMIIKKMKKVSSISKDYVEKPNKHGSDWCCVWAHMCSALAAPFSSERSIIFVALPSARRTWETSSGRTRCAGRTRSAWCDSPWWPGKWTRSQINHTVSTRSSFPPTIWHFYSSTNLCFISTFIFFLALNLSNTQSLIKRIKQARLKNKPGYVEALLITFIKILQDLLYASQMKHKTSLEIEGEVRIGCRVGATGLEKSGTDCFYFRKCNLE